MGIAIGGGIFVVPNLVARSLPTATWILACWSIAGIVSFIGALACAELGAAFPATGGQYVFIREAYGPLAGFLYGWTAFLVARTAQVAWLAVVFTLYVGYFIPVTGWQAKALALVVIALFAGLNYAGVQASAAAQKLFTAAKLVGLAIIIGGAVLVPVHAAVKAAGAIPATVSPVTLASFGVAMIACLLGYDGWVQITFVAGEIKRPQRNILFGLAIGVAICAAVYLLANVAYMRVMTVPEIAASTHVGASAAERALGPAGGVLVSIVVLLSIVGTINGCFLTSPRIYFAQARDGLFFRRFGEVHPRFRTPGFAILAQAAWSGALVITGSYDTLIDYAMFAIWVSYGFMVAGLMILRRTRPAVERPYRMWGYPLTPLLFVAVSIWFLANTIVSHPAPALAASALILAGIPAYFLWRKWAPARVSVAVAPSGSMPQ